MPSGLSRRPAPQDVPRTQRYLRSLPVVSRGVPEPRDPEPPEEGWMMGDGPSFTIYMDGPGRYRRNLRAANGERLANSTGEYWSREACIESIDAVRRFVADAHLHDETRS